MNRYLVYIMPRIKQDSNQSCFVRDASPAGTVTVDINLEMTKAPKWSLKNESILTQKYKNETLEITRSYFSKQRLLSKVLMECYRMKLENKYQDIYS